MDFAEFDCSSYLRESETKWGQQVDISNRDSFFALQAAHLSVGLVEADKGERSPGDATTLLPMD